MSKIFFPLIGSILLSTIYFIDSVEAAIPLESKSSVAVTQTTAPPAAPVSAVKLQQEKNLENKLKLLSKKGSLSKPQHFIFDLPVTYNQKVSRWINFFQTRGSKWFRDWLEVSYKYMPYIQQELRKNNLPTDLAYMVMIESGFSATAISTADAVGPWQFIESTGLNYGLRKNWWLDERRDLRKATRAATKYLSDLYREFGSWYLVAASYNMGEGGLRRRIKKYKTRDYWELVRLGALPQETQDYVPKILAAMLIAKAPGVYGFRDLERMRPLEYEIVKAPGGTNMDQLADHLSVTRKAMKDLNAELFLGYIPKQVDGHFIRVPKGTSRLVREFLYDQEKKSLNL